LGIVFRGASINLAGRFQRRQSFFRKSRIDSRKSTAIIRPVRISFLLPGNAPSYFGKIVGKAAAAGLMEQNNDTGGGVIIEKPFVTT